MIPMPNAFLTINLSAPSPAENPAAVSSPSRPLGDVAAGPIESPSNKGGHQEAPAAAANPVAAGATDLLGSDISDVGEIFYFARLLCARARLHPEEDISPAIVDICDDVWRDPPPQFLREGWR